MPERQRYSPTQMILVLIGGHAQRLLRFIRLIHPDVTHVLVIDAADELTRLGAAARSVDVQCFSLGVGHTAQTLTIHLSAELREHLARSGGMEASGGLGQALAVGHAAAELLVNSPEFQQVLRRNLLPKARSRSGGALESVRLLFAGSLSGATFAGGALVVARALVKPFLDWTSASVSVEFLDTGGLTYEGLGDRTWQNAACAATQLLAYVTDPARDPREVRRIRFLEFEVLGADEALRDAYLAQVEQAAHCEWMRLDRQRRSPNEALNGRFGNAQTWEVAFGQPLDPAADIAPVANQVYGVPIRDALNREPPAGVVEALELAHDRTRLDNGDVEAIVADGLQHLVDRSLTALQAPTYRHQVHVLAQRSANHRVAIAELHRAWASAPTTCGEADTRHQLQRRLLQLLTEEARELASRRQAAEEDLARAVETFCKLHRQFNPPTLKDLVQSAFTSAASRFRKLLASGQRIREVTDRLTEIEAEQAAVEAATASVQRAVDYLHGKLTDMSDLLASGGPPLGNQPAKVVLYPLDDQFPELWDAVDEGAVGMLDAVRRSVQYATLDGLAALCGSTAAEVDEVAKLILSGQAYTTPAVPWGGRRRADQGRTVHVLPPLDPELRQLVTQALGRRNPELLVAFTDRAPAVVNVVALTMRLVRSLGDVLTEPYLLGLQEALEADCPQLAFPEGLAPLDALGITRVDGKVSLPTGKL